MTKLGQAARQALGALEVATTPLAKDRQEVLRAITTLREALSGVQALSAAPAVLSDEAILNRTGCIDYSPGTAEYDLELIRWYRTQIASPAPQQSRPLSHPNREFPGLAQGAAITSESGAVYAPMPRAAYIEFDGREETAWHTPDQMRDFADRTHALRMEQATPKVAPGEREQAAQRLRELGGISPDDVTDPLHPRYIEGYKAGHAAGRKRAAPQQEAQEPVAWYEYNADLAAWFLAYRRNPKAKTRPLVFGDTAPQPAPAPLSDDVVREAARWRMVALIGNEVMLHPEKRTQAAAVKAYMDATHSGLDLTGAVDAALAAQGGQ